MSWDVLILSLPEGTRSLEGLPEGYDAHLAPTAEVLDTLHDLFPTMDFTDPTWCVLLSDTYSMEFSVGSKDPCQSIMLHVRGDEAAIEPIRALCERTGWRAFDTSDGELIEFSADPAKGLRAWRAYRGRVAPGAPERGISLPAPGGGHVFFDSFAPSPQTASPKRWWQFWKKRAV